ncbi:IS66 family transposase [Desulfotalea psychrophila]|uniref:IS66 family transposase n=1 Tax=Desulfotalea psychrophila TaxID=84980 RepID=UPI0012E9AB5C
MWTPQYRGKINKSIADKCEPLRKLLQQVILSGPLVNVDETTIQVLQEPGCAAETKSSVDFSGWGSYTSIYALSL